MLLLVLLFTCNLYFASCRFHLFAPHGVVPAAADGLGTPSSSSFYTRPAVAAFRVAAAAPPPPMADDDAAALLLLLLLMMKSMTNIILPFTAHSLLDSEINFCRIT